MKMRNSENISTHAATLWSFVGFLRSLKYVQDLSSASLFGQSVQKRPTEHGRSMVSAYGYAQFEQTDSDDFKNWLKNKDEDDARMRISFGKSKIKCTETGNITKPTTNSKVFAATNSKEGRPCEQSRQLRNVKSVV